MYNQSVVALLKTLKSSLLKTRGSDYRAPTHQASYFYLSQHHSMPNNLPNNLIGETSPYLLQHANNPVDWHAWSQASLALAAQQDKPILLSVGYAACHWCHVMAHESFENQEIAATMNARFICIKVDREERPDLDKIYQTAHQMLTQRAGGWPLTVALTPCGHAPFFAGTYFPPKARHGMPGLLELLEKIANHYDQNKAGMARHTASFERALAQLNPVMQATTSIDIATSLQTGYTALRQQFDAVHGGFGAAPKFPHPTQLELLLRYAERGGANLDNATTQRPQDISLAMANKSMRKMQQGGLFDQLEGGFFRYSVDQQWQIPHFEKMLYDNAQLLGLYALGYQLTAQDFYRDTIVRTTHWITTEIQQPHGGYASTLDADSEGAEGKFYVWNETDLRAILSAAEYAAVENYFGLYGEPNFEGQWHFNRNQDRTVADVALSETLNAALAKLKHARSQRIRPALDDKILTAWNGLMIKGMALAGRLLNDPKCIASAQRAVDFVRANLWKNGRLMASYRNHKATLNGYLDDYVFLAEGLLALLQWQWRGIDFTFLQALCDAMIAHFEDPQNGGFYFTSHDHEKLLYRPKPGADDAIPSANGAAASLLYRVGVLVGNTQYIESATKTLALYSQNIAATPSVFATLTIAAADASENNKTVVVRGSPGKMAAWQQALKPLQRSGVWVYYIADDTANLPDGLALKAAIKGKTVGYVCQGFRCSAALTEVDALIAEIG